MTQVSQEDKQLDVLLERQLLLEEWSVTQGIEEYYRTVQGLKEGGKETLTRPTQQFIHRNVELLAKALKIKHEEVMSKKSGKSVGTVAKTRDIYFKEISYEAIALHTISTVIESQTGANLSLVQICYRICTSVLEEVNFWRFKKNAKKEFDLTQKHISRVKILEHKRNIMRRMMKSANVEYLDMTPQIRTQVGTFCVDVLIEATGMFEIVTRRTKGKTIKHINTTPVFDDWMNSAHEICASFTAKKLPMLVPPVQWSSLRGGGYLSMYNGRKEIINSRFKQKPIYDLESLNMDNIFNAVNLIQETPWKINSKILDVAKECWDRGISVGKRGKEVLPLADSMELPEFPKEWNGNTLGWKQEDPHGYTAWCQEARRVHVFNNRNKSKRISVLYMFNIAEMFKDEERFYFPHILDFRGRVYPIPTMLTPQGDDLSKGLLEFAEGKPLGETGLRWLHIHVANCFGVDKVSLDERQQWTLDNLEYLLDCAIDPMNNHYWMEADKPFGALAGCMELLGHSIHGDDFKSHLPIAQDGSCNGLQNFSALLRDSVGGKATNLIPSDKPEDIYTEVLNLVEKKVHEDALAGDTIAISVDGKLSRNIVKQPVMTVPYGVTVRGMFAQVEEALKKNCPEVLDDRKNSWRLCQYLADTINEAIGNVVVAARAAMDYLQECTAVVSKYDIPITWITPTGFPVLQNYRDMICKRVQVFINGKSHRLRVNVTGDKLNKRKQKSSISPNFIHSLDSSHLMWTVLIAKDQGIDNFAMIHDSYAVHACDTDVLHQCLRTAFVELYSNDILGDWTDQLKAQIPEELHKELPDPPEFGDLDLEQILDSDYFFA